MSAPPAAAPRHNLTAEMAVIGAILLDQSGQTTDEIGAILTADSDFYKPANAELYRRLLELRASGASVETMTLMRNLPAPDLVRLGGAPYLLECRQAAERDGSGAHYARQVRELALLRAVDRHAARAAQMAATVAPYEAEGLIERIQQDAGELGVSTAGKALVASWSELSGPTFTKIEEIEARKAKGDLPGIPTGWSDLDRLLNNLQGGQMIIIAGRPGMGKSVAGRNILQHNAMRRKTPGLLVSLEMSATECMMAFLSAGTGVPLHKIRAGELDDADWAKLARYIGQYDDVPLFIDEAPGAGLSKVRNVFRELERRDQKPQLLVWDYLQITSPLPGTTNRPRQEQVSELSRAFKLFAKEQDIPVIVLCQLNRGPEQRADKRPALSDLRESGSLEQDADVVGLLHRDDYYDKESPRAGEVDFIVAKHRQGPTDTITLAGQWHLQRMMDMAIA